MKVKLLVLATLFLTACLFIVPARASTWVQVVTFSGASSMNTDYFDINCTEWRLNWTYTPTVGIEQYAQFTLSAVGKNGSLPITISQMGNTTLSGASYAHNANGTFYLGINVANLAGYTIIIEEDLDTVVPEYSTMIVAAMFALTVVAAMAYKRQKP